MDVILIGCIIIFVAAVSYSLGRSARMRDGSHNKSTEDTGIIRLKALSPRSQGVLMANYQRLLEVDDKKDPRFKRVQCD